MNAISPRTLAVREQPLPEPSSSARIARVTSSLPSRSLRPSSGPGKPSSSARGPGCGSGRRSTSYSLALE
jgi:hypothetical protein